MIYSPQVRSEGSPHPHRTPSPRLLLPACQCVNRAPDLMSQPSVQLHIAHDRVHQSVKCPVSNSPCNSPQ